jgi:hypothetical protein
MSPKVHLVLESNCPLYNWWQKVTIAGFSAKGRLI